MTVSAANAQFKLDQANAATQRGPLAMPCSDHPQKSNGKCSACLAADLLLWISRTDVERDADFFGHRLHTQRHRRTFPYLLK